MSEPKLSLPAYIDSSMLSTWRSCRRKHFWSSIHALYPTGKSIHLIAGGAFAAGMEAARRVAFKGPGTHRPTHDDLLQAAFAAFLREWGDYEAPEDSPKSFHNTFAALEEYLRLYPPATDVAQPLIRPDGSPAVEFTFSIPLDISHPETGDPILFSGRFDMLGTWNGVPCILDEKTTSQLGFAWVDQWRLRGQFMGYLWACRQLGYEGINTAIVRGIALLKRDFKFVTHPEQFPNHMLDRWYNQLMMDVQDIVDAYRNGKNHSFQAECIDANYPYNFADACASYGGCAFASLCLAKDPEPFFSNYIRHRWDPLAKQPVKEIANAA